MKIEIDVDLDMQWDWHMKKHNNSKYTKEELIPEVITLIKAKAERWWMGDHFFDQDRHMKEFMDTVINNHAFHIRDIVIVKTDNEDYKGKDSVIIH